MKKIIISEENAGQIEDYLASVNGRASSHTISRAQQLVHAIASGESRIRYAGLPKAAAKGWRVAYTPGGLASSYRGAAITTRVVIERDIKGYWSLVCAERETIYGGNPTRYEHYTTEAQQREIARRSIEDLHTISVKPPLAAA